jgi:uncharacterized repeat protein (TIGR03803 family)
MNNLGIGRHRARVSLVALAFFLGTAAAGAAADSGSDPGAAGRLGKVSTLASLTPETGEAPSAGLILADDGNFYGVTTSGGAGGNGTVLRIAPSGATTTLYSFPRGGRRYTSHAPLVQGSDGALYGVEISRDANTSIIFRLTLDGQFSQLQAFDDAFPSNLTLGRDGRLYGTTVFGGANGHGELFAITNSGVLTVIASLSSSTPYGPQGAPLEGDDGNFYFGAGGGGSSGSGGLLQVSPSGTVTTLYEFTGTGPVAGSPSGPLLYDATHEYLWGQTFDSTVGAMVVFRYKAGAVEAIGSLSTLNAGHLALGPDDVHFYLGSRTNVYSFAAGDGGRTVATLTGKTGVNEQLTFNAAGLMFGTTIDGGTDDGGTVFKVKRF